MPDRFASELPASANEFAALWTLRYIRADGTTRADGIAVGVALDLMRRGVPVAVYDLDRRSRIRRAVRLPRGGRRVRR